MTRTSVLLLLLVLLSEISGLAKRDWTQHIKLSAGCNFEGTSGILITLHTERGFNGSVYSTRFPRPPCRVDGDGSSRLTQLVVAKKCGVASGNTDRYDKLGQGRMDRKEELRRIWLKEGISDVKDPRHHENALSSPTVRGIAVRVQQDANEQRSDDAEYLVQCKTGFSGGLVTRVAITEKDELKPSTESSLPESTPEQKPRIASSTAAAELGSRPKPAAAGWMEIIPLEDEEDHLRVGELVSLNIKVGHVDGDTMLSSCVASTEDPINSAGSGGEGAAYDLTDFKGCAVDVDLLPNFSAGYNSKTRVKSLKATFPMFKFPNFDEIHVKCSVLVCENNCPLARCGEGSENDIGIFPKVRITDKFDLETSVTVVDASRGGDAPSKPETDLKRRQQVAANYHKTRQSVEPQQKRQQVVKEAPEAAAPAVSESRDLLCLSPVKLIIAFGVLLIVLVLALLAACLLWLRARSALRRPIPFDLKAVPTPPPRTAIISARPLVVRPPRPPPFIRRVAQ